MRRDFQFQRRIVFAFRGREHIAPIDLQMCAGREANPSATAPERSDAGDGSLRSRWLPM